MLPPILSLLRPHQWVKNLLVFVALITSHRWRSIELLQDAAQLFVAFCLVASAVYAINDVLDRDADAAHPDKRHRPVASGAVGVPMALAAAGLLLALAALVVWPLGIVTVQTLVLYAALALAYCLLLKRLLWLDVIALASLYVLRVIAGALAIDVVPSPWLLAFAGFVFLSLATLKRNLGDALPGRAYRRGDEAPVLAIGAAAAVVAVMVLALYVNSPDVRALYRQPAWIWLLCPVVLYWMARLWTLAARAELAADPIVFALRDRASWLVLLVMLSCIGLAL
jgi:4-hydroxybenzoate polyprenyltransferase